MVGAETEIEWADATWNPVRGCSRVSPGCQNCYAETMAARFSGPGRPFHGFALQSPARWTRKVELVPAALDLPLRWRKPRRIFVNSMSDLFHESLSNEAIAAVFGVMAAAPQHTFQILTKRAERLPEWFAWLANSPVSAHPHGATRGALWHAWTWGHKSDALDRLDPHVASMGVPWPLPNAWIGVSVEDQQRADERIPHLLRTPAAVRFLSVEPMLGPVDIEKPVTVPGGEPCGIRCARERGAPSIDWVIVGGESGHGARPMRIEWARSIVEQCKAAGTACFVKQLGARPSTCTAACSCDPSEPEPWHIRDRKGGDMREWPADLRVREFPNTEATR